MTKAQNKKKQRQGKQEVRLTERNEQHHIFFLNTYRPIKKLHHLRVYRGGRRSSLLPDMTVSSNALYHLNQSKKSKCKKKSKQKKASLGFFGWEHLYSQQQCIKCNYPTSKYVILLYQKTYILDTQVTLFLHEVA